MRNSPLVLLALVASLIGGCDGSRRETPVAAPGPGSLTLAGKKIDVTLLRTEKERRHAETRLRPPQENQGVLLAWPRERFMKIESQAATTSQDVLFLDASGAVVDQGGLRAGDPEGLMPRVPAAYALLLAPGMAGRLGVKSGDRAVLSAELLDAKPEDLPVMKINGIPARVELALTEPERQHGLMFRPRMSEEDGMLFAYETEDDHAFWMKNTLIPLDIAFFSADGTLLNVNDTPMFPDPRNPPANYESSRSAGPSRYVLEMNRGWFKRKGIVDGSGKVAPGSKAEFPPQAPSRAFD
jgi:uncharacterized membrane protein (UPF0127 family)